uniref:Uncharacterized protein n=1 Tax=Tanacetum cinerariifolium TaxID=118510 RepID=A0A6L2P1B3_TANCI|nr:hypothetical protein [Tanacetum cinerariifolium]
MEGRKPSELMETMDIMDPIPYVGSVHCITQDLALSDCPNEWDANDDQHNRNKPAVVESYNVNKIKHTFLGVSLPPCAATFYYGDLPLVDIVESCQSIQKLNLYLKASKDDVNVGFPRKNLRVVLRRVSEIRLSIKEPLSGGLKGIEEPLSGGLRGSERTSEWWTQRRIQVKDILKEVKDYLNTYSSAGMDISWRETQYHLKARQKVI